MKKASEPLFADAAMLATQLARLQVSVRSSSLSLVREIVEAHGLTPDEVFGRRRSGRSNGVDHGATAKPFEWHARLSTVGKSDPKYTDGAGRTWTGVGRQPVWFKEAVAAGRRPEEMLLSRRVGDRKKA